MQNIILLISIILIFSHCVNEKNQELIYFNKGELSKDNERDSTRNVQYSQTLKNLGEKPLRSFSTKGSSFRLLVFSSIYNPYCITVDHCDSLTSVSFKMLGDKKEFVRTGLSHLEMNYQSSAARMDSLYNILFEKIEGYDFYPGVDDPTDYITADGTWYLLESSNNGVYNVVGGRREEPHYKGREELLAIIRSMHAFIPGCFLPELKKAKVVEDLLFTVFTQDSVTCE